MKLDNINLTPRQLKRRENYSAYMNARKEHQRFRRRLNRRRKKVAFQRQFAFQDMMTVENLYNSVFKCAKGVSWKYTVQDNVLNAVNIANNIMTKINNYTYATEGFVRFHVNERGKMRYIQSPTFENRVIQKVLCDKILIPILTKGEIYDNGASLKGKGVDFTRKRLVQHMASFYRKHGSDGWVLQMDFSKYFDKINHVILERELRRRLVDENVIYCVMRFVKEYGNVGLGLGAQLSQILATCYPSPLDHLIKENLRCKYYGRYMDDTYQIYRTKEECELAFENIRYFCKMYLDIDIHKRKTKIFRLSKGITFLKCKYKFIGNSGKILKMGGKESIKRELRKICKFRKLYLSGELQIDKILNDYLSYRGHIKKSFDSRFLLMKLDETFNKNFIEFTKIPIHKLAHKRLD